MILSNINSCKKTDQPVTYPKVSKNGPTDIWNKNEKIGVIYLYNSDSPTYYYGIRRNHWTNWIGFYPDLRETRVTQEKIESRRQAGINRGENHWPIVAGRMH